MERKNNQGFPEYDVHLIICFSFLNPPVYLIQKRSTSKYTVTSLPVEMILRFVNYLMIVLFSLAAVVQYNDPDPLRWMLIYGAACVASILYALKKLNWIAASAVIFISGIWALLKIPHLTVDGFRHMMEEVSMIYPGVEAAREFLGLLIIFFWVTGLAIAGYREKRGKVPSVSE